MDDTLLLIVATSYFCATTGGTAGAITGTTIATIIEVDNDDRL